MLTLALVLAGALPAAPAAAVECAPVRLNGAPPVVCSSQRAVPFELENRDDREVMISIALERLQQTGEWEEHCPDVLHKSTTKQILALVLAPRAKRQIIWEPQETCDFLPFTPGLYRLLATVTDRGTGRRSKLPIAYFEVKDPPCCAGPAGLGRN